MESSLPKRAWTTLITNGSYVAGLLTVYRTLRAVSSYPLIVLATESLSDSSRRIIRNAGLIIIDVPHLEPAKGKHAGFDPAFARFQDTWTKLQVFGLSQFERLILIDADMIFVRSMDELFDIELPGDDWIAAAPACTCNPFKIPTYPDDWIPANCSFGKQTAPTKLNDPPIPDLNGPRTSHLLNSGLVILQPSQRIMDILIHHLNTSPSVGTSRFPDQDVIAEVFRGKWKPLPWWCNALKTIRAVHPSLWEDTEVRLIHYILEKPWVKRPSSFPNDALAATVSKTELPPSLIKLVQSTPTQTSITQYDDVHAWWWVVYEQMLEEMKSQGDRSGWREVDATVTR